MSHLLSFLEQYSHFQQLQQQADQYRVQLKRHRVQHRRQMKALRASYRQRLRDKNSIISSLEEAITQQQSPSPLSEGERGRGGEERAILGGGEWREDGKLRCERGVGLHFHGCEDGEKQSEVEVTEAFFNNHVEVEGGERERSMRLHRGVKVDLNQYETSD